MKKAIQRIVTADQKYSQDQDKWSFWSVVYQEYSKKHVSISEIIDNTYVKNLDKDNQELDKDFQRDLVRMRMADVKNM